MRAAPHSARRRGPPAHGRARTLLNQTFPQGLAGAARGVLEAAEWLIVVLDGHDADVTALSEPLSLPLSPLLGWVRGESPTALATRSPSPVILVEFIIGRRVARRPRWLGCPPLPAQGEGQKRHTPRLFD